MINYNEINKNIKNNVVTDKMILLACYSVNKRSKYYRNKCFMWNRNNFEEKKEDMYELKRFFLKFFNPKCIHKENHYKQKIIKINNKMSEDKIDSIIAKANNNGNSIEFINKHNEQCMLINTKEIKYIKYYLYYDINGYRFHYPISEDKLKEYSNLEIITLPKLVESNPTELANLLPLSLVYKIYELLKKA